MALESEDDVKRALEIDSWRNLSREKVMRFAAMMPDMDKEVALKIVAQFPVFTRFALGALSFLEKATDSTHVSNNASQERVHEAYGEAREILRGELDQENLSPEERRFILEAIVRTADKESEKDTENKRFLDDLFKKSAVAAGAVIAAGLVFVGGKVMLERGDSDAEGDP